MPDKIQHGNWRDSMPEADWNNFEDEAIRPANEAEAKKPPFWPERGRMIAEEAIHTINGERQDQYGNPEDTFQLIADLWSAYLGNPAIQAEQVADMMVLLKIAREAGGKGKKDNMVDLIGYAMIGARMRGYDA